MVQVLFLNTTPGAEWVFVKRLASTVANGNTFLCFLIRIFNFVGTLQSKILHWFLPIF